MIHKERASVMDDLYKLIEGKCKERGIKISKLCTDVGIRQSILSDLTLYEDFSGISGYTVNVL